MGVALVTALTWGSAQGDAAHQRSIDEFVAAQGTFEQDVDGDGVAGEIPDDLYVPPIENFMGWSWPARNLNASVDYAGRANEWIEDASDGAVSFGTATTGTVTEHPLADGRAEIFVRLRTTNALTWVISGWTYATDPLLFGYRAPDCLAGAPPARWVSASSRRRSSTLSRTCLCPT